MIFDVVFGSDSPGLSPVSRALRVDRPKLATYSRAVPFQQSLRVHGALSAEERAKATVMSHSVLETRGLTQESGTLPPVVAAIR